MLDEQIDSATENSGYEKIIEAENALKDERCKKFDESAREMLRSNGLM